MSVPIDHHYLPCFYLARWTRGGKLYRYVRPIEGANLHQKKVTPEAIGYEPHLYSYAKAATEFERTRLEHDYFQHIDGRAARALVKIEAMERGSAIDHVGLVQFVLSMLHRSPARIARLRDELAARMSDIPDFDRANSDHNAMIRDQTNDLLTELISSDTVVPEIVGMKVYRVPINSRRKLVTCDLPLLLSDGTRNERAFLLLPYAPDRLIVFAHREDTALAFSTQDHDVLVNALNDAIVRQARHVVISIDDSERTFIEERFDPFSDPDGSGDDGLMRWNAP